MNTTRIWTASIVGLLVLGAALPSARAQQLPRPVLERFPHRDSITAIIAELRRIHTPEGIETLEQVELGGVKQWISIRGRNTDNPVLLFIHGGPGTPMMPLTWAYQGPWEDFFTVVQWDQRGAGKNAVTTDRAALAPTMSVDRVVRDAEELTAWLRQRFHKDKIVVMGYSWGTEVGTHLAKKHPEWLSAYVGVGQVSTLDGEKILFERTLERARRAGNTTAVKELEALAPYPSPGDSQSMVKAFAIRRWARVYNGGWYGKPDFTLLYAAPAFAPEYTAADVDAFPDANSWTSRQLFADMMKDDLRALGPEFQCPVLFFMGRYDLHTPYESAKEYFDTIRAPRKKFVSFERSSHFIMLEEPGRFLVTLVNEVLPLTEGAATFRVDP